MNKAFKFCIEPNENQRILFAKTFGCCRFIYNRMLSDKIEHFKLNGKKLQTTPAQYKAEFPWLREIDSLALANSQINLQSAYQNFFNNKAFGFPNYKRKHASHNSYTTNYVNGNIILADGFLKLPKIGLVRVKQHRQIPADYRLKSVTVSLTPTGKYYASILYEYDADIQPVAPINVLGLDFSMPELYVDSNGMSPAYPRYYRQAQSKLAKEQRKMSRRKKGGKNYIKQKLKVARIHEHIANQRKDFLHKQSRQIANAFDAVSIEDLDMKGMSQALHFGKSVSDNGWGMFTRMLEYKLAEDGKQLVKIDKWFPSSKTCSQGGCINETLKLGDKAWVCSGCGKTHNRDTNAAINIRNEGLRILAA